MINYEKIMCVLNLGYLFWPPHDKLGCNFFEAGNVSPINNFFLNNKFALPFF